MFGTLNTIAALCMLAAFFASGGIAALISALLFTLAAVVSFREQPQRPKLSPRPAGPGWYWNRALSKWTLHPKHATDPPVEDAIDAAVAAWKHVYGEDIGFNEHAVTLEWLGRLYEANDLSSEQLADCADSVEWLTWALKQPDQNVAARRKLSHLLDEPSVLSCGCSETSANLNCRHARMEKLRGHGRTAYQEHVARRSQIVQTERRPSYADFENLRAQFGGTDAPGKVIVLKSRPVKSCKPGCASFMVQDGAGNMTEHFYCDGSHTRGSSDLVEWSPQGRTEAS